MSLRLRGVDGSLVVWVPSAPPKAFLLVETEAAGALTAARARAVAAAARGALIFLGYEPVEATAQSADLRVRVASSSPEAADWPSRGFAADDFHYFCLKTHPGKPLNFTWDGLSAAHGELSALRASADSLSGVTLEPSSRGVTGYQHRFREVLSRDFDFPEALACVWDGLRPGALSPGSKAAFLRAAMPALGLGPAAPSRS